MKSESFVYWLQGFFELSNPKTINEEQTDLIKKHLAMVFIHEIDPAMGDQKHQDKLNTAHGSETTTVIEDDKKPVYLPDVIPGYEGPPYHQFNDPHTVYRC